MALGAGTLVAALALSANALRGAEARPAKGQVAEAEVARLKNVTVELEGRRVTLVDGVSEAEAASGAAGTPGTVSRVVTRYFGNAAAGDLDGDGVADAAFVVTQARGGSGTFYYAVAALARGDGYVGTNGVLLGDRVAPQATSVGGGTVLVSYAERGAGEAMTARPSVGAEKRLRVVAGRLLAEG